MVKLSPNHLTELLDTRQSMSNILFDIVHWVRSTYGVVGLTTLIIYSATAIELIEKDSSGKEGGQ